MPSRSAHRHALRRSKEPLVIAPLELPVLPTLPRNHGWRNPVRGDYYQRDVWELYRVDPHASATLATVQRVASGGFATFFGSTLDLPSLVGDALATFEAAANRVRESDVSSDPFRQF